MAELNVGADPINPAYYAGTACAEIIEHMPTNVGFAAKYAWRLGEKDSEAQEAGKAIWYLKRQINLMYQHGLIDTRKHFFDHGTERAKSQRIRLGETRYQIVMQCVYYTITGDNSRLEEAIKLFETYL